MRMLAFSLRTRAYRGFRDWNICYERVFEYGSVLEVLAASKPRRVLDVAGDISIFGCFVAHELECAVDIVDIGNLEYCDRIRRHMPHGAQLVSLMPRTKAEELPPDRRYDVVYCISSIEHFDGHADLRFVESAAGLLEDGGLLLLTAPYTNAQETKRIYREQTYNSIHGMPEADPGFYMRYYSLSAIRQLAERSGLELVRLSFAGEIINFCEPIFQFGTTPARGRWTMWPRYVASRAIGALSPLYPFLFMRESSDPGSFTCGPRRSTPCNPDTFFLVLRKAAPTPL